MQQFDTAAPEWMERAACRGMSCKRFFTTAGTNATEAKRVCDRCLVRAACLDYAMDTESRNRSFRYGIWGGLTPNERRALGKSGWQPGDVLPDVRYPKAANVA